MLRIRRIPRPVQGCGNVMKQVASAFRPRHYCSTSGSNIVDDFYKKFHASLYIFPDPCFDADEPLYSAPLHQALNRIRCPPVFATREKTSTGETKYLVSEDRFDEVTHFSHQPTWVQFNVLYHFLRHQDFFLSADVLDGGQRFSPLGYELTVPRTKETFAALLAYTSQEAMDRIGWKEPTHRLTGYRLAQIMLTKNCKGWGLQTDGDVSNLDCVFSPRSFAQLEQQLTGFQLQSSINFVTMQESGQDIMVALKTSFYHEWTSYKQVDGQMGLDIGDPLTAIFTGNYYVLAAGKNPLLSGEDTIGPGIPRGIFIFTDKELANRFLWAHGVNTFPLSAIFPVVREVRGSEIWPCVAQSPHGAVVDFKFVNDSQGILVPPAARWLDIVIGWMKNA